ncbi:MAG: META domain-containing protein [Saprospiraceae bacterium]
MKRKVNINSAIRLIIMLFLGTAFFCHPRANIAYQKLYLHTWELEYITGLRIAFEGLYPDKKPKIRFNKETHRVEGNNSCNGYAAEYKLKGDRIAFGEPGPTTMMYCGEGEQQFLMTIKKVNRYQIDADGKLNLLLDNVPMLRFKPIK